MADTAISQLTKAIPAGNNILPYSTGSTTLSVPVSALFQNSSNIGIGTTSPSTALDVNGISTLRNGLILSSAINSCWGQGFAQQDNYQPGTISYGVARYFGNASNTGTTYNYNHIILPFDYDGENYSRMFLIEIKGYEYGALNILDIQFAGYSTPPSNSGPLNNTKVLDATGGHNAIIYYSSARKRVICRFTLNNYFASYVVNSIAVGNGRVINPGEIEIVETNSASI